MSDSYRVYLEEEVVLSIIAVPHEKRRRLQDFIRSLANNPFTEGDFSEEDSLGRKCFCKVIDDWAISYFPDHSVKEVKVFEMSPSDT